MTNSGAIFSANHGNKRNVGGEVMGYSGLSLLFKEVSAVDWFISETKTSERRVRNTLEGHFFWIR